MTLEKQMTSTLEYVNAIVTNGDSKKALRKVESYVSPETILRYRSSAYRILHNFGAMNEGFESISQMRALLAACKGGRRIMLLGKMPYATTMPKDKLIHYAAWGSSLLTEAESGVGRLLIPDLSGVEDAGDIQEIAMEYTIKLAVLGVTHLEQMKLIADQSLFDAMVAADKQWHKSYSSEDNESFFNFIMCLYFALVNESSRRASSEQGRRNMAGYPDKRAVAIRDATTCAADAVSEVVIRGRL
ncbi:hypothetical protein ACP3V3_02005 [Vibrio sp. PNB22_3_1]